MTSRRTWGHILFVEGWWKPVFWLVFGVIFMFSIVGWAVCTAPIPDKPPSTQPPANTTKAPIIKI